MPITEKYPSFKVPAEMAELEFLPDDFTIDIDKIRRAAREADMHGVEVDTWNCLAVSVEDTPTPEQVNMCVWEETFQRLEESNIDEEYEEALLHVTSHNNGEIKEEGIEVEESAGETAVAMTRVECSLQDKFFLSEQLWRYNIPLCDAHLKVTKTCEDCKRTDSQAMANDDQLYKEIEDTLVLVEDPEDPERFFIRSDMKYLEKSPGAGKLHNSLVRCL